MSGMKMLIALQLLLCFVIYSFQKECATYYIGSKNKKTLTVTKTKVASDTIKGDGNVSKVRIQSGCLFFIAGSVYGPETEKKINVKAQNVQCCCELVNSEFERFLNRHQLTSINDDDQHFKTEMDKRCIPNDNRPVHTFVDATEQQLKGICGKKNNKVNCMSRDSFKVYDIQCKKNGHYTNEGNIIRQTQIVVTCEDNFPVHFVCVVERDENCNNHDICQ